MNLRKIHTSSSMIGRMLMRRRIVALLIALIPVIFLSVVDLTTSERTLPFQLASIDDQTFIEISERTISLIFFAVASTGFLVAFLALNLIQKDGSVNRRLVICGYRPQELMLSVLLVLLMVIGAIALYVGLLSNMYFSLRHLLQFMGSLALVGFVYGSYGLLVGSLIKGELEGILMIVLLVNIDVGWLQNPLFYAEAQNQFIIKLLPAYFPSQAAIIAAVTDYSANASTLYAMLYASVLLFIAMIIYYLKMRTRWTS